MFQHWQEKIALRRPSSLRAKIQGQWRARAPFLLFAFKSALAAAISWEIARVWLGEEAAALAPVSAIIVLQITGKQTIRKGLERILGVLIGVSLSILTMHVLGVTFWAIFVLILCAQIVGMFVQKRGAYLATQIPISALLGYVVGTSMIGYPLLRLMGAIIGAISGVVISFLLSPPIYVTRARAAVAELTVQMAHKLPLLADAVAGLSDEQERHQIYTTINALEKKVRATEQELSLGFDSVHLTPWSRRAQHQLVDYPDLLLALSRIVRQMRRTAFTINEPLSISWEEITRQQTWPQEYARLLRTIGHILARTGCYMRLLTRQSGHRPYSKPGADDTDYKKDHIIPLLKQGQEQLQECENMLHMQQAPAILVDDPAAVGQPGLRAGHHLSLQGTILTDMRRMLNELHEVITLLPPQSDEAEIDATIKQTT